MKHILSLFFLCVYLSLSAHESTDVFSLLKTDIHDTDSLLSYFRNRKRIELPGFSVEDKNTEEEQKWAEEALEHRFFVHSGYQPSLFYGDDID
ncbi:MAG: heparinase II/III family protein, partial [Candidatus Cryptobacteroides sp.]